MVSIKVELRCLCPVLPQSSLRYVYVIEHLASLTFLMIMMIIIHLQEMAAVYQILIFLSNIPKDGIVHNVITTL